jgi:hypothetical protein
MNIYRIHLELLCGVISLPFLLVGCPKPTPNPPAVPPPPFTSDAHWSVPAGVNHIFVAAWGGGGGGSSGDDAPGDAGYGGVGGFGSIASIADTDVNPGQEYVITIGLGGAGGIRNGHDGNGQPGGNTTVSLIGQLPAFVGQGAPGGAIIDSPNTDSGNKVMPPDISGFTTPGRGLWSGRHPGTPGRDAPTYKTAIPGYTSSTGGVGAPSLPTCNDQYGASGGGGGAGFGNGGEGGQGGHNGGEHPSPADHAGKQGSSGGPGAGGGGGGGGGDAGGAHGIGGSGGNGVVVIWWITPPNSP